ncbi:type I restriction enzyme [Neisseria gonorrhoeae]|nr:type I restriction enzyme [Neisseria gonorrhoeae]CNT65377.1 type I restriction enzyme [Neisseria gonorrhoeae]STZ94134.1 type I restriction enzyme [Neisseria gonorrhoeae]
MTHYVTFMSQTHNENSRVKIPAVLHLMRLGYDYLSLKNANWDRQTNIFPEIFVDRQPLPHQSRFAAG